MVPTADRADCMAVPEPECRPSSSPAPGRERWLLALGVVLVAVHNGLVGAGLDEIAMLAASVGLTTSLVVLAMGRAGLTASALGLRIQRRDLLAASMITTVGALVVLTAALTRLVPPDPALSNLTTADRWFRALVAIPIGTAICEEVTFRGVLLAAADRLSKPRTATITTSVMFGLWHLAAEARRTGAPGPSILPGVLATTAAAALILCPLRRRTGGLATPVALHTITNLGVFTLLAIATPPPV
jgi:membrane protease YdiL (CAAX protease family)